MHNQNHSRVAGVLYRLGVVERRIPRWIDEARAERLTEYERAVGALIVR